MKAGLGIRGRIAVATAGLGAAAFLSGQWWVLSEPGRSGVGALGAVITVAGGIGWLGGRWLAGQLARIVVFMRDVGHARPLRLPVASHDEFGAVAAALRDMTQGIDQRIAAMAEDRTRLEAVLSGMVEGMMVLDHGGRILLVNAAMERVLDGAVTDIIGRGWIEAIRHHGLAEMIGQVLKDREPKTTEIVFEGGGAHESSSCRRR